MIKIIWVHCGDKEYKWKWSSQLWSNFSRTFTNKAQEKLKVWGSNGIWTHDLHDTGAMLYQLSYEASLEADQMRVQLYALYEENDMMCIW